MPHSAKGRLPATGDGTIKASWLGGGGQRDKRGVRPQQIAAACATAGCFARHGRHAPAAATPIDDHGALAHLKLRRGVSGGGPRTTGRA
jgi:hypothetical protein